MLTLDFLIISLTVQLGKVFFIMMDRKIILINTHPYSYADTLILVPYKNKKYSK